MGVMDGAMGGVMGGSMGAMLSVMMRFPDWALMWTGVLLTAIWIAGMVGLVVLIEQSAPGHAAFHRLLPMFARAVAIEAGEEAELAKTKRRASTNGATNAPERRIVDYYALLGVPTDATDEDISDAYLATIDSVDAATVPRIERAFARSLYERERDLGGPAGELFGLRL